jgi:predicted RecB family nuclease
MMTDLTDIDGIGPSYAEELEDNGYGSAEAVADADPDELDSIIDTHDGETLVANAEAAIESDRDEFESAPVYDDEPIELGLDLDDDQRNHLIKGLVNEEIRARRTNKAGDLERMKDAIQQVIDGDDLEFTKQQLDAAYRAVNGLESEYRSQRGVGTFTTKLRTLKDDLQSIRAEHHSAE